NFLYLNKKKSFFLKFQHDFQDYLTAQETSKRFLMPSFVAKLQNQASLCLRFKLITGILM
ncbi:MAG: hypothetical protein KAS17_00060, partial [Victivallaceae bacterium]|nr:hypothetical protein [Victivallaceae bacterium]